MNSRLFCMMVIMYAATVLAGCTVRQSDPPKSSNTTTKKDDADDHDHGSGPHGGTVFHFGKWHGEFTMNHKSKKATVYVLAGDAKKAVPIQAEKLLLSIKEPPFKLELAALPQEGESAGKSSRFVGTHETFGKEQEFEGTVSVTLDGKTVSGDFKEEPEMPKKEGK